VSTRLAPSSGQATPRDRSTQRTHCRASAAPPPAGLVQDPGGRGRGGGGQHDLGVGRPQARHIRAQRGLGGPREVRMPAKPGRHRCGVLVRKGHVELEPVGRKPDSLRDAEGPGPCPTLVTMLERYRGLVSQRPGRIQPQAMARVAFAGAIRRPHDRSPAEDKARPCRIRFDHGTSGKHAMPPGS